MATEAEAAVSSGSHGHEDKVACSSCHQLASNTRTLYCQHLYCLECLDQLPEEQGKIVCSTCNLPSKLPVTGPKGLEFMQLADHIEVMTCSSHNNLPLDKYCESCNELVCVDCCRDLHSGHNYSEIGDRYSRRLDQREVYQAGAEKEICRIKEAIVCLKLREEEIVAQGELVKEEVGNSKKEIFNILNKAEERVKCNVDCAIKHKISILKRQIESAEEALSRLEVCIGDFRSNAAASTQQFLLKESQVTCRTASIVQSMKRRSFEPLEHADLQCTWKKMIDCVKKKVTSVRCRFHPLSVQLINSGGSNTPVAGEQMKNTFAFSPLPCGEVPLKSISCNFSSIGKNPSSVPCVVKATNTPHQFTVSYAPMLQGLHELHIMVNKSPVMGSPFTFVVHLSPSMRGIPLNTFSNFTAPCGVDTTEDGDIVVTELNNCFITMINGGGRKMKSFSYKKDGGPAGVACTTRGTVLVTDRSRHEIQEYTMEGRCVGVVGGKGSFGCQFRMPMGIAVNNATNEIYVADTMNHRIQVFNQDLTFSKMFGSKGSEEGLFNEPWGLAVDSRQSLYVADSKNHRVQKFTAWGEFLFAFGKCGYGLGKLMTPAGIAVDRNDFVFVSDFKNHYISVFNSSGLFVHQFGDTGTDSNIFNCPCQLTFDHMLLYVCDLGNNRICVF